MPRQVPGVGLVYDTDNVSDIQNLKEQKEFKGYELFQRPPEIRYGSAAATVEYGLIPIEAVPDALIALDEVPERFDEAHELQALPIYHMYNTWRPKGTRYNQNGLGYCWTWSGTGCVMTTRGLEDKETVLLAPVSMGYLVGWKNQGNYLASFVKGAREDGICPGPLNSLDRNSSTWNKPERALYKLDMTWDTRKERMKQHCASILYYGRSIYIAYNWWGHALELVSIRIVNGVWYWDISNSHNEPDVITLDGSKAEPDEAIGFISTVAT